MVMPLKRAEAVRLIAALRDGMAPNTNLDRLVVGRDGQLDAIREDLDQIERGGATVRFICGKYGSGKTLLLQVTRQLALHRNFLVATADLKRDHLLAGRDHGRNLYRQLVERLESRTREKNALPALIEEWLDGLGLDAGDRMTTPTAVRRRIADALAGVEDLTKAAQFQEVLAAYHNAIVRGDDQQRTYAIRWLHADLTRKQDARNELGGHVGDIISGDNYLQYLRIYAAFARKVGYAGLLVCIDELAQIAELPTAPERNKQHDHILAICNHCADGYWEGIGFLFAGTPEAITDARRGLFAHEALASRLRDPLKTRLVNHRQKVLTLEPLGEAERLELLGRVAQMHADYFNEPVRLDEPELRAFYRAVTPGLVADTVLPRELIRKLIAVLDLMQQYPGRGWQDVIASAPAEAGNPATARPTVAERPPAFAGNGRPDGLNLFEDFRR